MSAVAADKFAPNMSLLANNQGGQIQSLPNSNVVNGRDTHIERIALVGQTAGCLVAVARVPLNAVLTSIDVETDTALGASGYLSFGDVNTANYALYAAQMLFTATDINTNVLNTAQKGTPITTGYDSYSAAASSDHEDIVMKVGSQSALPTSGTLVVITHYSLT